MEDKQGMIKQILTTVRSDPSLWPKGFSQAEAEHFLSVIEELINPVLNSKGFAISQEDYDKAKEWAQSVMDIYIQKNPFQGAFVRPIAVNMFESLDKIWLKRAADSKNGSWL